MKTSRALALWLALACAAPVAAHAAVRVTPSGAVTGAAVLVTPGGSTVTIGGQRARVLTVAHGRARVVVPKLRPGRVAVVVGRGRHALRGRMTIRRPFSGAIRTTPVTKAAVRAPIGPQGGTLTARHAGVTFTLTVPPGALAARTKIVMTPIAAIRGLPLSGRAAAVRFGPEGLTFAAPATLTVRGVRGKLIGFTAAGTGARLGFIRARRVGNRAVLAITHFSTAGAGGADAADFAAAVAPLISGLGPMTEGEVETLVGEIVLWQER